MPFRALAVALLPLFLIAATPAPVPPSGTDHVALLGGTWTCRTFVGSTFLRTGRRDGDLLDVSGSLRAANGQQVNVDDRYTFDRPAQLWHVRLNAGTPSATEGSAPPWTGATWDVSVHGAPGVDERVRYELLADGSIRRTFAQPVPATPGAWRSTSAELCAQGETAPAADACVAQDFPAFTISIGTPPAPAGWKTPGGRVTVVVSLNAQSQVVGTRIQQTPTPALDDYVLQTVQLSRFQTEIRDCKPIATDYVLALTMKPGTTP